MENDVKEFLSELLKQLKSIDYIKAGGYTKY